MLQIFWEVLKDLWSFLTDSLFRQNRMDVLAIAERATSSVKDVSVNKPVESLSGVIVPVTRSDHSHGRVAYVQYDLADCLSGPDLKFDCRVETLLYGEKVEVNRIDGVYAEVFTESSSRGWVEVNALSDNTNQIFPNLKSGFVYGAKDQETFKLRRFLQDETFAHRLHLPLQSTEYALYILKRQRIAVKWPPVRPREPGAWQSILRGLRDVSMSIEPHTAAIFEYMGDTGTPAFLGYVEAVRPDQSITVKSVGRVETGEYRVEEFTQEEWKEWRPIFISFA